MANLSVVQFLHPGGEHEPDSADCRSWNRANHQRTFLRCRGAYVGTDGVLTKDEIMFWGEWEPPVRVVASYPDATAGLPRYICEPYLDLPDHFDQHQNTDPFVFGERFIYAICQQYTVRGPTGMQSLERGSIVLFGSHKENRFYLDTVFVVGKSIEHDAENYEVALEKYVPREYIDAVLRPWYASLGTDPGPYRQGRLYLGATYTDPVAGMFSFFPCLPAEQAPAGFARPVIQLSDYVTDTQRQSRRVTPVPCLDTALAVWRHVVRQVEDAGLRLGIRADLPQITTIRTTDSSYSLEGTRQRPKGSPCT